MAFNERMHPRNIYKNNRPNFKLLADKHEHFKKEIAVDDKGRVTLDFKNPAHLKALTCVLLKNDFDIDVDIPLDRLIPTVPLRINYILWIEDLLSYKSSNKISGVDVGCGPACIYSLLGAKKNSWTFLASETDLKSYDYAVKNVQSNKLSHLVKVVQVPNTSTLECLLKDEKEENSEVNPSEYYDFCMCNPPFFENSRDAWGVERSRSDSRPEPKSVNTASDLESIYPGGEIEFVKKVLVDSSLKLGTRVKIYTTMLGKKTSLKPLISHLKENKITNITTTEFCQGNTMRWGLAWSLDDEILFPTQPKKQVQASAPIVLELKGVKSSVQEIELLIHDLLKTLKMKFSEENTGKFKCELISWLVTANENTWIHQRRKRRLNKEENDDDRKPSKKGKFELGAHHCSESSSIPLVGSAVHVSKNVTDEGRSSSSGLKNEAEEMSKLKKEENEESGKPHEKRTFEPESGLLSQSPVLNVSSDLEMPKIEDDKNSSFFDLQNGAELIEEQKIECCKSSETPVEEGLHILQFLLNLTNKNSQKALEFHWRSGDSRELLHQVYQFFKNHFEKLKNDLSK